MHAGTRISFMNDVANLCEIVGADVNMVRKGSLGCPYRQPFPVCRYRLWRFLFPKRYKSVDQNSQVERLPDAYPRSGRGGQRRAEIHLVPQVGRLFQRRSERQTDRYVGPGFKPETDDMREAPALILIDKLCDAGARVRYMTRWLCRNASGG